MRKFIPAAKSFAKWEKDPAYRAAYDALDEEFALASALTEAHSMTDAVKHGGDALQRGEYLTHDQVGQRLRRFLRP